MRRAPRRLPPPRRTAGDADEVARAIATETRAGAGKCPGSGHPLHHPVEQRAERILELATERRVAGPHVDLARRLVPAVAAAWGRPMPMNVSMAITAVLLDLDFLQTMIKAIPLLARTGGLLAHLCEEKQRPDSSDP